MASLRERTNDFNMSQLLDDSTVEIVDGDTIKKVPKDFLYSIDQVRTDFNEVSLQELALNIKENGQQQPIIVHPLDSSNKYCIHQGERRWRAICLIDGIDTVDCLVRTNNTMYQQLSENIQRENLSPYEISAAILNLKVKENIKSVEVSQKLGKSKSWTSQYESISKIPKDLVATLKSKNVFDINVIANIRKAAQSDLEATVKFVVGAEALTRENTERFKIKITNPVVEKNIKAKIFKLTKIFVSYKGCCGVIVSDSNDAKHGTIDIMIDDKIVNALSAEITIIGYSPHP